MDNVRLAVIGAGNMGVGHLAYMSSLKDATLAAICDTNPKLLEPLAPKYKVPTFAAIDQFIKAKVADAVLIATPHPSHAELTIAALDAGLHVLCEKPLSVTVKEGRRMIAAAQRHPDRVFSIMYQMRTSALYRKMRDMIATGELGEITRISWTITNWFRTCAYYASGGWRATWAGEGGGVLINQCPHNLDLLQWISGMMPSRITAVAALGKRHPIEVEDEISAILEYPNGAVGHFITTTGEAPGTNRLEIAGDHGLLIAENGKLTFRRTRRTVRDLLENEVAWPRVETWTIDIPTPAEMPDTHQTITQNFINAIVHDEPLIAPGADGVRGLEIGNAMLMAGVTRQPVDLPMDVDAYEQLLKDLHRQRGQNKAK